MISDRIENEVLNILACTSRDIRVNDVSILCQILEINRTLLLRGKSDRFICAASAEFHKPVDLWIIYE